MNDDDSNTNNVFEIQNSFSLSLSLSLSTDFRDWWCSFASSVDGNTRAGVVFFLLFSLLGFFFSLRVVFDDSKSPTDTSSQASSSFA